MIGSDHQLMSFSQDPIGSAIGSANAITVRSGLIPRGRLIGPWLSDRQTDGRTGRRKEGMQEGEVGEGCFCSVVQAFIDPLSNTALHLVVVFSHVPHGPC